MSNHQEVGSETPVRLLRMEEELAGPQGAEALSRYDRQLVELGRRCQAAMDAGQEPADFERCRMLQEAVTVARKIIRFQRA